MNARQTKTLIGLLLAVITLATFYQVAQCDFVSYDDYDYVLDNPDVRGGLSRQGIAWAFTTGRASNWHPVTWIAHMISCEMFGVNPKAHHAINLLVHIANVLLLFNLLTVLTGSAGRSGFVAALFAIHPLHVESVAWISGLTDVLSTLFWLLAVWAYAEYAERGRRRSYFFSLLIYAVGLMSKPMLVTLPVILLLLDYWPLDRIAPVGRGAPVSTPWRLIVMEKVPFLFLSAVSAAVTFVVVRHGGAVVSMDVITWSMRIKNALMACQNYLLKMVWPSVLAIPYPYAAWPLRRAAVAALLLLAVSIFVAMYGRRFRCLVTGWLWYLVMLLPVIGLVHVRSQAMADRYTYLSLVGPFIMLAFGIPEAAGRLAPKTLQPVLRRAVPLIAGMAISVLAVRSWFQVRVWRDSSTLFAHAARVTRGNEAALNSLGLALMRQGKIEEAVTKYREALSINSGCFQALNNLGVALLELGRIEEAISCFVQALEINTNLPPARLNLGTALVKQGKMDDAIAHYMDALRATPNDERPHRELVMAISRLDDDARAIAYYRQVLDISPGWVAEMNRLAWLLATRRDSSRAERAEALRLAKEACRLEGGRDPDVLQTLATAYASAGFYERAVLWAARAVESAEALYDPLLPQLRERLDLYKRNKAFYRD